MSDPHQASALWGSLTKNAAKQHPRDCNYEERVGRNELIKNVLDTQNEVEKVVFFVCVTISKKPLLIRNQSRRNHIPLRCAANINNRITDSEGKRGTVHRDNHHSILFVEDACAVDLIGHQTVGGWNCSGVTA